jgi:uncharacterized protein YwgA
MQSISRKDLVMLLVGLGENRSVADGLGGITRLQKYLYLLEQEGGVKPDERGNGFHFEAYKAGPYSSKLYDDIEFLENLGYLQGRVTGTASEPEEAELDALSFEDLLGEEPEARAQVPEERAFMLTEKGKKRVQELMENSQLAPVVDGVRKVKSRFASHSLNDLLRYVYQKYPEMTTESEIKDKVLGRKRDR